MVLRRLVDAVHCRQFGKDFLEQAGFIQKLKTGAGGTLGEQFGKLLADALSGDNPNFGGMFTDSPKGSRLNGVAEASGKADCPKHAEFVFPKAAVGVANSADDMGLEILLACDEIEDFSGVVAHQEAVDGEVAALNVFFG